MKVKTKTQLKQALAKILNRCRQLVDIANSDSEKALLTEFSDVAYEALEKPSILTVDYYVKGEEPPSKRKKRKPKETQQCSPSTCSSQPSPSGT